MNDSVSFITGYSYRIKSPNSVPTYTHEIGMGPKDIAIRMQETDFANKAVVSLNELYIPFSTTEDDILYTSINDNPRVDLSFVGPQLPNRSNSGYFRSEVLGYDMRSGINIGTCPTYGDEPATNTRDILDKHDTEDVRSLGLRVPFMYAGFGYDAEGFPVPSLHEDLIQQAEEDEEDYWEDYDDAKRDYANDANAGNLAVVRKEEAKIGWNKRTYARKFRERQDLWKAGPFDVRWDQYKEMWVAAPEVFQGYAMYDIPSASGRYAPSPFTSGEIAILTGRFKEGTTSEPYSRLLLINRSKTTDIASGAYVTVIRAGNGEYIPLHVDPVTDASGNYYRRDD
jgi:hypothetical protein